MEMLPSQLQYGGAIYDLHCETMQSDETTVILTYEHRPVKEDSFLISCCGNSVDAAQQKMVELLKTERLI